MTKILHMFSFLKKKSLFVVLIADSNISYCQKTKKIIFLKYFDISKSIGQNFNRVFLFYICNLPYVFY